ncbi:S-layer homology domain-containing protein [Paenibacillus sp. J5C_2022]|uniref:S-layer homology domain-containing protein n=1 Tax=Paenibacillus sp. J5C2022 TaxID=2977129 RepID=UPI0021D068B3|nr:S-layer homology domain-containing protein [Paenibacillus sp. J5C2022]MCU6708788.1 S-layer homology domain-containing protein [Paenibacillus sp. J5C2022]
MTLRRKIAASTIAASLAVTAFAGIPLSNKGLAEKLGASAVVYAADAFPSSDVINKVKTLREALIATGGLDEVNALRTAIQGLSIADRQTIAGPIINKLVSEFTGTEQTDLKVSLSNLLVDAIGITYDADLTKLEELRTNYHDDLQKIATAAEVDDLTVDDIVAYFLKVQDEVVDVVSSKSLLELKQLLSDADGFNAIMEEALASITGSYDIEDIFLYYGVTTEDVRDAMNALKDAVSDADLFEDAALALYGAYAYIYENSKVPPIGGGGGVAPGVVEELVKELEGLKDKLANATDEEKAELIADAVKKSQEVIGKATTLKNLTAKIVDGLKVYELDAKETVKILENVKKVADQLKESTGVELEPVSLNVELGEVSENGVSVSLVKEILEAAAGTIVSGVNVTVNGLGVTIPFGGTFSDDLDLSINWSEAEDGMVGGLPAASAIYDFNLSVGGKDTTEFSHPIILDLPIGTTASLDEELLTVAKVLEDGTLEIHGGRLTGARIVENRPTFSSYVVVENKVSFEDVARVEAWAGRSIQVMAAKGAIIGKSEGKFAPDDKVTRAEFAKMLVRALDLESNTAKEGFNDVSADDWFASYVAAAVEKGVINGRSETRFAPEATITRAEMATMIARALGADNSIDVDAALADFSDADEILDTLKAGVAYAAANGIVEGKGAGKFAPNDNATRAQAAVIIHRALNK